MFDGRWRQGVERGLQPVGDGLRRTGITANRLTAMGLVLSVAAAVVIASGHPGWGTAVLIASAVPDLLDGAVAKASGTASPRGAFLDSVADRVSDSFVLGGVAWYLASAEPATHLSVLPLAVLGASTLVSYQRARAESLGFDARGGLMERAERITLLCIGLTFSVVLVPVLWVMLTLTVVTAMHRFAKVWRQATPRLADRPARWRWRPASPLGTEGEWRRWRERRQARQGRAARPRRHASSTRATWRSRRDRTRP